MWGAQRVCLSPPRRKRLVGQGRTVNPLPSLQTECVLVSPGGLRRGRPPDAPHTHPSTCLLRIPGLSTPTLPISARVKGLFTSQHLG